MRPIYWFIISHAVNLSFWLLYNNWEKSRIVSKALFSASFSMLQVCSQSLKKLDEENYASRPPRTMIGQRVARQWTSRTACFVPTIILSMRPIAKLILYSTNRSDIRWPLRTIASPTVRTTLVSGEPTHPSVFPSYFVLFAIFSLPRSLLAQVCWKERLSLLYQLHRVQSQFGTSTRTHCTTKHQSPIASFQILRKCTTPSFLASHSPSCSPTHADVSPHPLLSSLTKYLDFAAKKS